MFSSIADALPTTKIGVYNSYSLSLRLEVKCDHDWKTKRFLFHKFVVVKGKKKTTIIIPNNMRKCQVWPKIIW
jgi:hypothetical protein